MARDQVQETAIDPPFCGRYFVTTQSEITCRLVGMAIV